MKKRTVLAFVVLFAWLIYRFRRHILSRLLKLPPPQYDVEVDRNIPVTMPDGVRLFTDHYFPKE